MECTGSYASALARHLTATQIEVFEVNKPDRPPVDAAARTTQLAVLYEATVHIAVINEWL